MDQFVELWNIKPIDYWYFAGWQSKDDKAGDK
jgi:hypothetical protein